MKKQTLIIFFLISAFIPGSLFSQETLKMASTTSIYETGLLDIVLPPFEKANNTKVQVLSVGSGKAFALGDNGDVDIIFVHSRADEENFLKKGAGIARQEIMYNYFILIGPKTDPANTKAGKDMAAAFRAIADRKSPFVSRGDNSGTHVKELAVWNISGIKPEGAWYLESGQGMTITLKMAEEKEGYTLIDMSTFAFNASKTDLVMLKEDPASMKNVYSVIVVNPEKYAHVKKDLALKLSDWLSTDECKVLIKSLKVNGKSIFFVEGNTAGK
jgi:tungstate transport system substrate-binding protein